MAEKKLIKKYPNRRLYDTEKSTHITLQEIGELIKEGNDIQVLDAKTDEDVTAYILTQIILEEARQNNILLPSPVLHLIIRYGGTLLDDFFKNYFQQVLNNYLAYKNSMDQQFRQWIDLGRNWSDIAQKTLTGMPPFNPFENHAEEGSPKKKKPSK
ncbi:MAG TPA: polyhydroxyalkanoate synthesis regulator DNA-binding domain-containing protein [Thermodesulfobacteriota bacterium]|nr:polyhydroxyalkanoate synthesis regulator DNA-binding domain-containing protein [Thermodesulfobacteriota bacterium]